MKLAMLLALAVLLGGSAPAARAAPAASPDTSSLQALRQQYHDWVRRLDDAKTQVLQAQHRFAVAKAAVEEQRSRRYPLGKAKARLEHEFSAAKDALAKAEDQFPTLLEQARRAGVPPGVLRPYRDFWDDYEGGSNS